MNLSDERHRAPEILFDPTLIGSKALSVTDTLLRLVTQSDIDLTSTIYTQVVLAGGEHPRAWVRGAVVAGGEEGGAEEDEDTD